MRRHTPILAMCLLVLSVLFAPVSEAMGSNPLPYHHFLPLTTSSSESTHSVGQFSIIQPKSTTNLVTNPSPKTATTGYTAVSSASLALVTTKQKRDSYSLEVTPASGTGSGVYYLLPTNTVSGQDYTASVDFWGPVGLSYTIYVANTSGTIVGTATTVTGDGRWHRYEVTYTENSSTTRRIYITKNGHASLLPFYIDGLQFENLAYATTYCDGAQKGCSWTGAADASTSQRSSQERSGGKLINLETLNAYLVSQQGTGMPDITNLFTPYAGIDGGFYQKRNVKSRTFTIAMSLSGSSVADWHIKRQAFIDLVKPDLVYPTQPFVLVYDGGGVPIQISCYYDGGFEMVDGKREIETIAIRCLAVDPFWRFDGNAGAALNVSSTIANAARIVMRSQNGTWSMPHSGVTGTVYTIAQGLDNTIYVGGRFGGASGVSNTANIAKYDLTTNLFSAMGTGSAGVDEVYDIQVAPNGDIWAVGNFTDMGGVAAADYVARWDGSTWNGVGVPTAIGALGLPIRACFGADGKFYLPSGGTALRLWNGSAWSTLGLSNGTGVFAAVLAPDGTIIVAHNGTTMGGVSTPSGVARWTPSTSTWSAVGTTASLLRDMVFDGSGRLYGVGSGAVSNLYIFNGVDWSAVGAFGTGSTSGYSVAATPGGSVFVGGSFNTIGTTTLYDHFAEWNGSSFVPPDINLPSTATVYELKLLSNGSVIVGYNTNGTATIPGITTVTNNGSNETYPKITIRGPSSGSALIRQIVNQTTKKAIYTDLTINAGETIVLDLTPGAISFVSNFQGNMLPHIIPGSTLTGWSLLPGSNTISMLSESSSVVATMTWPERCWSIDSSGV
jgi:hypothetical protein